MNWHSLLKEAQKQPGFSDRKNRKCHELRNVQVTITQEYEQPLTAVRKLGWLFPTNEELESVLLDTDDYHRYTYTQHIQRQVHEIVDLLHEQPQTRRAIMYLTDEQHSKTEPHLPCLTNVWFAIRGSSLHLTVHARSIDLLIGFPANLFQMSILGKQIAKKTHTELASITFMMNSAHVFEDYQEQLDIITSLKNR